MSNLGGVKSPLSGATPMLDPHFGTSSGLGHVGSVGQFKTTSDRPFSLSPTEVRSPHSIIERNVNNELKKKLEFPMNPALSGVNQTEPKKLDDFVNFCKKKNIAFDQAEKRYYKIKA